VRSAPVPADAAFLRRPAALFPVAPLRLAEVTPLDCVSVLAAVLVPPPVAAPDPMRAPFAMTGPMREPPAHQTTC
jgi:hypothetical protein